MLKNKLSKWVLSFLFLSTQSLSFAETTAKPITKDEILQAQKEWADEIVKIGQLHESKGDYKAEAKKTLEHLYGYSEGAVLFKPTKASVDQFRETQEQAFSYFVTGTEAEDHGFSLKPWTKVRFDEKEQIFIDSDSAIAMGNYYFTDKTGKETKVEFSFGYKRAKDSHLVIFLHHSSLPYVPESTQQDHKNNKHDSEEHD